MTMQATPPLILASGSPRRKELLASLGIPFLVQPSSDDELVPEGTPPIEMVEMLAVRKAASVAPDHAAGIVIGSDTIVVVDNEILGKPKDDQDAFRMLSALQGRSHHVFTGLAAMKATGGSAKPFADGLRPSSPVTFGETCQYRVLSSSQQGEPSVVAGHSVSRVTFRAMAEEEITTYIRTGQPSDKAGAYGVQGLGSVFIDRIEGDFYSVMGLPLSLLYPILLRFGIRPFQTEKERLT